MGRTLDVKDVEALIDDVDQLVTLLAAEDEARTAYYRAVDLRAEYAEEVFQRHVDLFDVMVKQRAPKGNRGAAMRAARAARAAARDAEAVVGGLMEPEPYVTRWTEPGQLPPDVAELKDRLRETLHWLDIVAQEQQPRP